MQYIVTVERIDRYTKRVAVEAESGDDAWEKVNEMLESGEVLFNSPPVECDEEILLVEPSGD
jgi:hypothetical protein